MRKRERLESALLVQIEALEGRLATLSAEIAALHLRREAARIASDGCSQSRWDEQMRMVEAEVTRVQQELLVAEKRYHSVVFA